MDWKSNVWYNRWSNSTTIKRHFPGRQYVKHFWENSKFYFSEFNLVIDSVFNKRTIDTITSLTGRRPPKPKGRVGSVTAPPPVASNLETTTIRFTTQGVGVVSQNGRFVFLSGCFCGLVSCFSSIPQNCGIAPHFTPCLDLNRANLRLLSCCRAKLLPEGCWPLCRYDTTQAEVSIFCFQRLASNHF